MVVDTQKLTVYFALDSFIGLFTGEEETANFGGAEVRISELARALASTGQVNVVLLASKQSLPSKYPNIRIENTKPPIQRGLPLVSRLINASRFRDAFSHHSGTAVFFACQTEDLALFAAAKEQGVKTIYWINGDSLVDNSGLHHAKWLKVIEDRFRAADAIITQSKYQQAELKKNFGLDSCVLDSIFIEPEELDFSKEKMILWVGRSVPIKRPWIFLELAKVLPQYSFTMLCPPDRSGALVEEIFSEAEAIPNIELHPGLSRDETLALYRKAQIVLSTSESEGLPGTLIEAFFSKAAYMSYKLDFTWIVPDPKLITYSGNRFDTLVEQVKTLIEDPVRCAQIGKESYVFAQQKWGEQVVAKQYLDYFTSLARDSSRSLH